MTANWREFWGSYRRDDGDEAPDLFRQVGRTIAGKAISESAFTLLVERIVDLLALRAEDRLLDLCCGNGLVTFELAQRAASVDAVDFAEHLIETARRVKQANNIVYRVGDVSAGIDSCLPTDCPLPGKVLMNAALAYFSPSQLEHLLQGIAARSGGAALRVLLTDVPDDGLKWNFYNTPERREAYLVASRNPDAMHDGMGRWWRRDEVAQVASATGFELEIVGQPDALSNYRIDIVLTKA